MRRLHRCRESGRYNETEKKTIGHNVAGKIMFIHLPRIYYNNIVWPCVGNTNTRHSWSHASDNIIVVVVAIVMSKLIGKRTFINDNSSEI